MDVRQLKYLTTIADSGSFSRAAGMLNMAQPSLSKQIRNLEETLGRPLLIRNGRGVAPTEAGERLIRHARRIIELVDQAEAEVRATGGERFAIGLPFTIAATIGSELIAKVREVERSTNLAVVQGRSAFLLESLWSGGIDMAIMYKPHNSPLVETTPLISEELFFMASTKTVRALTRKAPIPVESVCEHPLIVPGPRNAVRELLEHALKRTKKPLKFAMEIDNVSTILDLVAQGQGYSVLSKLARSLSPHAADIVPLKLAKPGLHTEICLAVSARGSLSKTKRRLVKLTGDLGRELLREAAQRRKA